MKDVQFGVFPDFKCGSEVLYIAMSKKGNLLACGLDDGEVQIWDYMQCVKVATVAGYNEEITGICFSNDGLSVFSSFYGEKQIRQWSVKDF